jgi:Zn-dependent protease with chaperone function
MSVSAATWPGPVSDPRSGAHRSPPTRRLWWMYLLVVLALVAMGGGAAQAWGLMHDGSAATASTACLVGQGIPPSEVTWLAAHPLTSSMFELRGIFNGCLASLDRLQAIAMMGGAVAVPLAAWLLMLADGLRLRRRLRGHGSDLVQTPAGRAAAARFETWCDAWHLTGRRRPRLLLASPGRGRGQAFTTGLPFGRPLVVVPVAFAYDDQATFDFVVLHELAHVKSRDLTWASSVWWAGWLSVPVLLIAVSPVIVRPSRLLTDYGSAIALAAVLSAALLALRASLLRRREHAADQHAAVALGGAAALAAALRQPSGTWSAVGQSGQSGQSGQRGLRRVVSAMRSLLSLHPAATARLTAVTTELDREEGGFGVTAAAGVLAMFGYQVLALVVADLGHGAEQEGLPGRLVLAAPCLLWAWVVVPAWIRRAAAAARIGASPTWAGPLWGAVLGLVAGYCTQIPGGFLAAGPLSFPGHLSLVIAVLVFVAAGTSVLAAGVAAWVALAGQNHQGPRRRLALTGAVVAVGTALSVTFGIAILGLSGHEAMDSAAVDRTLLMAEGDSWLWGWSFLIMVAGLAAAWPGRWIRRAAIWPVIGAVSAGGAVAALSWQLRRQPHLSADTANALVNQRWWICALAGLAATAVTLLSRRPAPQVDGEAGPDVPAARIPGALAAGFLTTVLAALAEIGSAWATGYQHNQLVFVATLQETTWLLFAVVVVIAPLLWFAAGLMHRGERSRHSRPRRLPTALMAVLVSGALSLAVLTGFVSSVTTAPHDLGRADLVIARFQAYERTGGSTPVIPVLPNAGNGRDPGRRLKPPAAKAVLADIPKLLSPGWKQVRNSTKPLTGVSVASCQELINQVAADNPPSSANITRTYRFPVPGVLTDTMTLVVSLTSYDKAAPGFSLDRNETAACAHFTQTPPHPGLWHYSMTGGSRPLLPYPAYYQDFVGRTMERAITGGLSAVNGLVNVGHNQASALVDYSYFGAVPPARIWDYAERLAHQALLTIISNLKAGPGTPRPSRSPASSGTRH